MKQRRQNQMKMVGACINVAFQPEFKPVWTDQEPLDFGAGMHEVAAGYQAVSQKAADVAVAADGTGDAKNAAEAQLADEAYVMARALAFHFKRNGDRERLGKVDLCRSNFSRLANQELIHHAAAIRDLAATAITEPNASNRGLTPARLERLNAALKEFISAAQNARGQVASRGALLKDTYDEVDGLVEQITDMDDLVVQFIDTELGARFNEAWKRARIVIDTGRSSPSRETEAPTQGAGPEGQGLSGGVTAIAA